MATDGASDVEKLRFVDPSIDLPITSDISKTLFELGSGFLIEKAVSEVLRRFPAVEYAIGFDGVDDRIHVDDIDIDISGIDIEIAIWISRENRGCELLDFANKDGESILTLVGTTSDDLEFQVVYKGDDGVKTVGLSRIEPEVWQNLRIWSDGRIFSVEIDGNTVSTISDIDIEDRPFKFQFGCGFQKFRFFKGMVKKIQIQSGTNRIFSLRSGKNINVEKNSDTVNIGGTHSMKKRRFSSEFRA